MIPLTNPHAYTIVAVYNLIYGVLVTIPIAVTLVREKNGYSFRQRRLVSVIVLLPLWYWLITAFGFHLLDWRICTRSGREMSSLSSACLSTICTTCFMRGSGACA